MPHLYREAPVNSIWEGSGNVIGLDVLRALGREPETGEVLFAELEKARGNDANLDRAIGDLKAELAEPHGLEGRMRIVTELMALTLQGALLTRHAPSAVAEAFCATRLGPRYRGAFGTLPDGTEVDAIIARAIFSMVSMTTSAKPHSRKSSDRWPRRWVTTACCAPSSPPSRRRASRSCRSTR